MIHPVLETNHAASACRFPHKRVGSLLVADGGNRAVTRVNNG